MSSIIIRKAYNFIKDKKYTEEDMRKCFTAGTKINYEMFPFVTEPEYKSFEDYINSLDK